MGLWKVSFGGGVGGGGARSAYLCSGSRVASLVKVTERDTHAPDEARLGFLTSWFVLSNQSGLISYVMLGTPEL